MDESLENLAPLKNTRTAKGWIRSIREALGMSGRQLAGRIHVETSRIAEMEKSELHGGITLKSLRRAAEAMDCELVYAFVPRTTLQSAVRMQAERVALQKLGYVAHTMLLEEQGLSVRENDDQRSRMVEDWVRNPPRWLWDPL